MTKILLVEDDKSLREIYGVRLLAEGYDIVSAGDGEEALAMAIKDRPALIVSDVMMPKISGFDMLDILRSTTETRDIKVIMMTALSSEDQRKRGESLGADRYLVKSQVGIEDVVRVVHEVLADAPTNTSAAATFTSGPNPRQATSSTSSAAATPTVAAPPRPAPTSQAPTQQQPATSQSTEQPANAFPQPTAPFSTPRPGNLGDRVIQPLERNADESNALAELGRRMEQELDTTPQAAPVQQSPVYSQPLQSNPDTAQTSNPQPQASVASQPTAPSTDETQPQSAANIPAPETTTNQSATADANASLESQMAAALQSQAADQAQSTPAYPTEQQSQTPNHTDLSFEETPRSVEGSDQQPAS